MTERKVRWQLFLKSICSEACFGPKQEFRNEDGQLHRADGPALISPTMLAWYQNGRLHGPKVDIFGSRIYYWRGTLIPKKFFTNPQDLTPEEILSHPNTEVRRVGLEVYGIKRLHEEGKCRVIHSDGEMESELLQFDISGEQPSTFVKVMNSTPEPDGSRKVYYLSVPPEMKTCREAVAWTFYMKEQDYKPQYET